MGHGQNPVKSPRTFLFRDHPSNSSDCRWKETTRYGGLAKVTRSWTFVRSSNSLMLPLVTTIILLPSAYTCCIPAWYIDHVLIYNLIVQIKNQSDSRRIYIGHGKMQSSTLTDLNKCLNAIKLFVKTNAAFTWAWHAFGTWSCGVAPAWKKAFLWRTWTFGTI